MIITFGYVTLFACKKQIWYNYIAAFPMASFLSILFIYFEARSDLFKLEKLMKRPHVKKAHSIGSWTYVLQFMALTSVFTNIILFTYASDQIDHLIPFLRFHRDNSVTSVVTIFTIEHMMLAIILILKVLLDKDPQWVSLYKKRADYKKDQKTLKKQSEAKALIFATKMTGILLKKNSSNFK